MESENLFQYVLSDKITLTLLSRPNEENIKRAMKEIPLIWNEAKTISKNNSTSYGMKHVLEHYRRAKYENDSNPYICNNDFIIAMFRLGFKLRRCPTWNKEENPNFIFNVSKHKIKHLLPKNVLY
ncbi:MAG: hypothetical protein P4L31_00510 [Candidatus Babeliales bacterium]|nr:hypothetical protein [Candidatus Babeliales bacterium]